MVGQVKAGLQGGEVSEGVSEDTSVSEPGVVSGDDEGEESEERTESDQGTNDLAAAATRHATATDSSNGSSVGQRGTTGRRDNGKLGAAEREHAFHEAWIRQAGQEGLLGSLVALGECVEVV
jgi:hypothetical protein